MISVKSARNVGVPLLVIETTDMQQSIANVIAELPQEGAMTALMRWDVCRGLVSLSDAAQSALNEMLGDEDPAIATANPSECLLRLAKFTTDGNMPERSIIFFMNAHLFWKNETVLQGVWNLRDIFKTKANMLVMLVNSVMDMPAELKNDTIVLTETLPNEIEVKAIISRILKDAGLNESKIDDIEKINDTLLGLPAFTAEQVLSMSLSKKGIDRDALWQRKKTMIEQTPGLSVWKGGQRFDDIGGYENVKTFLRALYAGKRRPRVTVFIDEIEKSLAANRSDSSGVSQDYLRALLTWMQDEEATGMIFVGPPGTGKSAIAKAAGNEAEIPTIALDLGGMKGSLVGESERRLRTALNVIKAVSQGNVLFIATCNSMTILPPELKRRFGFGTFYFPMPTADDRKRIWDIYLKKYGLTASSVEDNNWTGDEIRRCVDIAWRLNTTLAEAAKYIIPVAVSGKEEIERLSREANGKYISASQPGPYKHLSGTTEAGKTEGRKFAW